MATMYAQGTVGQVTGACLRFATRLVYIRVGYICFKVAPECFDMPFREGLERVGPTGLPRS